METYTALARATEHFASADSLKHAAHDSILAAHGFTRESFAACTGMYEDEPERWQGVWKKIEKSLNEPVPARTGPAGAGAPAPLPPDRRTTPKAR